ATWHIKSWQEELSQLVRSPADLFARLNLDPALLPAANKAAQAFPVRATESYLARIKPGDPNDPLLRQILPLDAELSSPADYSRDPLHELESNPVPGLVHKYAGRVLLVASGACAINCRYCFRRHFPYEANTPGREDWQAALNYIRADTSLEEVILSGGDPLAVSDKQFAWLLQQLDAIPHVSRLRIHSRLPIVLPSRISPEWVDIVRSSRLDKVLVIHANHPQELDASVQAALGRLAAIGVMLLNQSVLLAGVNDEAPVLADLSRTLFAFGVLPYYLHLLDKVDGAAHFAVPDEKAAELKQALMQTLPGYLVPRMVREIAGASSKTPF
ncbi:MAG TPA: EF-P beta-lysylation protein EpmB, partial [Marinagarivorans sp.]|nr:EF-P beta-lysylation protein EpmB [Marinagarivorans sp.]